MADVAEGAIPAVSESKKRVNVLEKPWNEYSDEPWRKRGSLSGSSPSLSDSGGADNWHEWALSDSLPPGAPQESEIQRASSSLPETNQPSGVSPDPASNEGRPGSRLGAAGPNPPTEPGSSSNPLGGSSSTALSQPNNPKKNFLSKFVSKSKSSLGKLAGKLKFKPRSHTWTSESTSTGNQPQGTMNAAQGGLQGTIADTWVYVFVPSPNYKHSSSIWTL